jgi:N-acetyltransferase 10
MDDLMNVLPISSHIRKIKPIETDETDAAPAEQALSPELRELQLSLRDTEPVGSLVELTRTVDQAKAVLEFMDALSQGSSRCTVALTAARGRGKSAALGLGLAAAVALGMSNMYVSSPTPENLGTLFEFIVKGLNALGFQAHMHYQVYHVRITLVFFAFLCCLCFLPSWFSLISLRAYSL